MMAAEKLSDGTLVLIEVLLAYPTEEKEFVAMNIGLMTRRTILAAAVAFFAISQNSFADHHMKNKPTGEKVTPGTEPTEAMGKNVPTMKGECPESAEVDTKAPGTEATEAMGKNVPTMTAKADPDCESKDKVETKKQ
jgi:hypothetical protein